LFAEEEAALPKAIQANCPERMPKFDLGPNSGMRLSEPYGLLWTNVSIPLRMLTIPRGKNGSMRHIPLNRAAAQALEELRKQHKNSEFVCGGPVSLVAGLSL
jgi:integrase